MGITYVSHIALKAVLAGLLGVPQWIFLCEKYKRALAGAKNGERKHRVETVVQSRRNG